jgi:hypothetical protein
MQLQLRGQGAEQREGVRLENWPGQNFENRGHAVMEEHYQNGVPPTKGSYLLSPLSYSDTLSIQ